MMSFENGSLNDMYIYLSLQNKRALIVNQACAFKVNQANRTTHRLFFGLLAAVPLKSASVCLLWSLKLGVMLG